MAKVAFLLANNFEDSEMKNPYEAVKEAGHETVIVGLEKGAECKGKKGRFRIRRISERVKRKRRILMRLSSREEVRLKHCGSMTMLSVS